MYNLFLTHHIIINGIKLTAKAEELDWQVYKVIQLKTISEICTKLPSTPKKLSKISGIGKLKLKLFSDELLDIVNDYIDEKSVV